MEIELINKDLLQHLHFEALANDRWRMNYELRTTPGGNTGTVSQKN